MNPINNIVSLAGAKSDHGTWVPLKDCLLFDLADTKTPVAEVTRILRCSEAQAKRRYKVLHAAWRLDLSSLADKPGARRALENVVLKRMVDEGKTTWRQVASVLGFTVPEAMERHRVICDAMMLCHDYIVDRKRERYPPSVTHEAPRNRLVVGFPDSEEVYADSEAGFYNRSHVLWVMAKVKWMFNGYKMRRSDGSYGRPPKKILILALYVAQVSLYKAELGKLVKDDFFTLQEGWRIEVKLFDPLENNSRSDAIIVDFVTTETLGICEDNKIQARALALGGPTTNIILVNESMLTQGWPGQPVERAIFRAEDEGFMLPVDCCGGCISPLHTTAECKMESIRLCSECDEPGHIRVECPRVRCRGCHGTGHAVGRCPVRPFCRWCVAEGYGHDECIRESEGLFGVCWDKWTAEDGTL